MIVADDSSHGGLNARPFKGLHELPYRSLATKRKIADLKWTWLYAARSARTPGIHLNSACCLN